MVTVDKDKEQFINTFISVLMPVYNGQKYLAEAIESVLQQTHSNFELIIIDDGSTDNSAAIIKGYAQKDSRIVLHQQKNSGLPVTLNKGIRLSKADIIARMDADDIMLPHRLEKQISFLINHPEAAVVSCYSYHIDGKGRRIGKSGTYPYIASVENCKKHIASGGMVFCLHPGVMFWKKAVMRVGGYNEALPVSEDTELWNRMADNGLYTIVMPERLIEYRIHMEAISSAWHKSSDHRSWVHTSIVARRKGEPALSFDEYLERKKTSRLTEMNNLRKAYGAYLERYSVAKYCENSYLQFLLYSFGALLLRPRPTLTRIKNHLRTT